MACAIASIPTASTLMEMMASTKREARLSRQTGPQTVLDPARHRRPPSAPSRNHRSVRRPTLRTRGRPNGRHAKGRPEGPPLHVRCGAVDYQLGAGGAVGVCGLGSRRPRRGRAAVSGAGGRVIVQVEARLLTSTHASGVEHRSGVGASTLIRSGRPSRAPCRRRRSATSRSSPAGASSQAVVTVAYESSSVKHVFAAARALRRPDWAALSLARFRAPRNVGRAMATRMPMIRTTTISSIRVKPSSSRMRFLKPLSICLRLLSVGACTPRWRAFSDGFGRSRIRPEGLGPTDPREIPVCG